MRAYTSADWGLFFQAMIGATAALAGLLFVAVSINLDNIVRAGGFLTARAAETLAVLLLVLASATLALVPQSSRLVGVEILIVAVPMLTITVWSQVGHLMTHPDHPRLWTLSRMAATGSGMVPAVIAGVSLAVHAGGGFYWLVPTALLGIAGAVYSAWVLLVEILR